MSSAVLEEITAAQLDTIAGGQVNDATAAAKRAAEAKKGKGSLDLFGYAETNRRGVGAEIRHRLSPNVSVFVNGRLGEKDNKPDNGVMGGIRFEW